MSRLDVLAILRDGIADYEESGHDGLADDMLRAHSALSDLFAFADSALAYVDEAAKTERQRHITNGAPKSQVLAQTVADGLRASLASVGARP